jgi:OmpA-OmpF porin, OOP family
MKALIAVLGFTVAAGFALPAGAQMGMSNVYVGATIGQSKAKDACNDLAGTGISCDDTDTAWKIFGGYQLNRNFAAELGYINLGKATASALGLTEDIKSTAWDLSLIGSYPLMDRLSIFGRLGVYFADVKDESNFGFSASHSNNDLTYGFGVRYDVTQHFGLRGEWQRYSKVGGGDIGKSDVDVLGITALWNF